MPFSHTVLAQVLKLVPRYDFEKLENSHHKGGPLRSATRWSQFAALVTGHIARRHSLRDVVSTLAAQSNRLYHLGVKPVARTSLARVNAEQPFTFYAALFDKLYARAQAIAPRHGFHFDNKLISIDASLIDLSLAIFPWSKFALGKGAMKLHLGLDHDGLMPAFAVVTDGRVMESRIARTLSLPANSIVVFDRGYNNHAWLKELDKSGVYFVTRIRRGISYEVTGESQSTSGVGVTADQRIRLTGTRTGKLGLPELRLVSYRCPSTGKAYEFLTNAHDLDAATIAAIYKSRWQIELFFKFLKQNLKLKGFYGTTRNAVLTQIWIALCVSLMIAYLKFRSMSTLSLQQILRLIETNLFIERDLIALLSGQPHGPPKPDPAQGVLAL